MSLIYVVVAVGSKVLCDYSSYKGNFEQATIALLKKVQDNTRASIQYAKEYAFYYWNIDGLTYICMCDISFSSNVAFAFLESVKKEFNEAYPNEDFSTKNNYALNDTFKQKLAIKLEYYNQNKDKSLDKTAQLKEGVISFKNETLTTIFKIITSLASVKFILVIFIISLLGLIKYKKGIFFSIIFRESYIYISFF